MQTVYVKIGSNITLNYCSLILICNNILNSTKSVFCHLLNWLNVSVFLGFFHSQFEFCFFFPVPSSFFFVYEILFFLLYVFKAFYVSMIYLEPDPQTAGCKSGAFNYRNCLGDFFFEGRNSIRGRERPRLKSCRGWNALCHNTVPRKGNA